MFILSHVQGRMFSSKDPVAHLIGDFFLAFLFCWPRSLARELQVNRFWNQCSRSLFVCRTSHQKNDYKKTSMKRKWASSKPTHHNTSHFHLLLKNRTTPLPISWIRRQRFLPVLIHVQGNLLWKLLHLPRHISPFTLAQTTFVPFRWMTIVLWYLDSRCCA